MDNLNPSSTISCPKCQQPILAHLEQILDVRHDPDIKNRLLSGQFNLVQCPSCGFKGMIGTPIVYHDPEKELLLTYVPVELNIPLHEKERVLGGFTRAIMSNIPSEERAGYLLQPKEMISLQGLINCVLEADGITPEMIQAQHAKLNLIEQLCDADEESLPDLIKQYDSELDHSFFQLLTAAAAQATNSQDKNAEARYLTLRAQLMQHSALGQKTQAQIAQLQSTSQELSILGKELNREKLLQLITEAEGDERITALATLARPLLDYEFFIQLTRQIEDQEDDARQQLEHIREVALEAVNQADAVTKARTESATSLIQTLMQATDMQAAIRDHITQFDELFLAILLQNQEAAQKSGEMTIANKLGDIRDRVMEALHASAPPEIRFINELLSLDSDEEATAVIKARAPELTPDLLTAMEDVAQELKSSGREELGERLDSYRTTVDKEIALAKWS